MGALQAAIEAAGLNEGKLATAPKAGNLENVSYMAGGKTREISNYAGTSGYLLQGDILSSLGGASRHDQILL